MCDSFLAFNENLENCHKDNKMKLLNEVYDNEDTIIGVQTLRISKNSEIVNKTLHGENINIGVSEKSLVIGLFQGKEGFSRCYLKTSKINNEKEVNV